MATASHSSASSSILSTYWTPLSGSSYVLSSLRASVARPLSSVMRQQENGCETFVKITPLSLVFVKAFSLYSGQTLASNYPSFTRLSCIKIRLVRVDFAHYLSLVYYYCHYYYNYHCCCLRLQRPTRATKPATR